MTLPSISQHADPDNRWSRFERNSGLPRNTFDHADRPIWFCSWRTPVVIAVVLVVYLIVMECAR